MFLYPQGPADGTTMKRALDTNEYMAKRRKFEETTIWNSDAIRNFIIHLLMEYNTPAIFETKV